MTEWHPNWADVYRGCVWHPDGDNDLIAVTRETLRLAKSAIRRQQEIDAYHNYEAAEREIVAALSPPTTTGDREMSNYDMSIHHNADAKAWAKFFMETWQKLGKPEPDEEWMLSWFANAMMAMYDSDRAKRNTLIDTARIAGLREAAEIVCRSAWRHEGDDAHSKGMDRGAREQNRADYDSILARIAELEKQ